MNFAKFNIDSESSYWTFKQEDIVRVNPIEYYKRYHITSKALLFENLIENTAKTFNIRLDPGAIKSVAYKNSESWWFEHYENIKKIEIHINIKKLLNSTRK